MALETPVQLKAVVPEDLKCRVFARLALRNQRFSHWLRLHLETWMQEEDRRTPALPPGQVRQDPHA